MKRTLLFGLCLPLFGLTAQAQGWEVGPSQLVRQVEGFAHPILDGIVYHDESLVYTIDYVNNLGRGPKGEVDFQAGVWLVSATGDTLFAQSNLYDPKDIQREAKDGLLEDLSLSLETGRKLSPGRYLLCIRLVDAIADTVWWRVVGFQVVSGHLPHTNEKKGRMGPYEKGVMEYLHSALFTIDPVDGSWVEAEGRTMRRGPEVGVALLEVIPIATDAMGLCYVTIVCQVQKESTGEAVYRYARTARSEGVENGVLENMYIHFETAVLPAADYVIYFQAFDELTHQWVESRHTLSLLP